MTHCHSRACCCTEPTSLANVSRRHAYRPISDPEARAAIQRAGRESAKSAQLVLQPARVAAARAVLEFSRNVPPRRTVTGDATPKGYLRDDLADAFARYLAAPAATSATTSESLVNAANPSPPHDVAVAEAETDADVAPDDHEVSS